MASDARITNVLRVGRDAELTWSLANAADARRMLCHVRSVLSANNVQNRVTMDADARKVFAMVKLSDSADAWVVGRTLADTFA